MHIDRKYIILADDDEDDRLFFEDALEDLMLDVSLESVTNGVEVMQLLNDKTRMLPDLLFLDLNMPLQSGHECLKEIRSDHRLKEVTIVVYSTSLNAETVDMLYKDGANYYICKPGNYNCLKKTIHKAISLVDQHKSKKVHKSEFIIKL